MSAEGNVPAARARGKARLVALALTAVVLAIVAFAGGWLMASRRIVHVLRSPDGNTVAYVMDVPCFDGPCQSLWIRAGGSSTRLQKLGEDSESCDQIVWTPDSSRVAFIVNGYQMRVFDAKTGSNIGAVSLIEPDGYPTSRVVRGVTFSSNGAAVTFDDCPRNHSGCKPGMLAIKR
jgi:hypothetical protein